MKPRRGLSEIIASMTVLAIVSVLGVMLYNLSLESFNGQQNNLANDVNTAIEIAQERFEIVSITKTSDTTVKIYLLNYGNVDIKISDIYLESPSGTIHPTFTHSNDGKLPKSEMTYITITYQAGVTRYKVVSEKGVSCELPASI